MSAPISGRLTQSLSIQASVSYDILAQTQADGISVPVLIGSGKFAKVYKAWQRSARRNVRPVAVKILHDHARRWPMSGCSSKRSICSKS